MARDAMRSLLVLGLLAAPAAAAEPETALHIRFQVPYAGAHNPVGLQIIGGEIGLQWGRLEVDLGAAWGEFIRGEGTRVYAMGGAYWTPYDGRAADGAGSVLRLPTLVGLDYLSSEWGCHDGSCPGTIAGTAAGLSLGVEYVYWGESGAGFNLRLLATLGLPLGGTVESGHGDADRSWDDDAAFFGSAVRLTAGVSL